MREVLIKEAYDSLNMYFLKNWSVKNTLFTRSMVKALLEHKLNGYVDGVICDETNNTSEIIDSQRLVAKIWSKTQTEDIKYINLIFGDVEVNWDF